MEHAEPAPFPLAYDPAPTGIDPTKSLDTFARIHRWTARCGPLEDAELELSEATLASALREFEGRGRSRML